MPPTGDGQLKISAYEDQDLETVREAIQDQLSGGNVTFRIPADRGDLNSVVYRVGDVLEQSLMRMISSMRFGSIKRIMRKWVICFMITFRMDLRHRECNISPCTGAYIACSGRLDVDEFYATKYMLRCETSCV